MPYGFEHKTESCQCNMTPIIDIVFLLIIFFMIVCSFIVAENFDVTVPDQISSAQPADVDGPQTTTVTVMFDETGQIAFAVGSEMITASSISNIPLAIAVAIDRQLETVSEPKRIVSLRIDKNIPYSHSQYALAGISQSSATDIMLAVTKQKNLHQ